MQIMTIRELNERLQQAWSEIEDLKRRAVLDNEAAIVDLNRKQMEVGQTSRGELIEPDLALFHYAREKKQRGGRAPFGVPDLKNTGAFHAAMIMEVDGDSYYIGSTDEKEPDLTAKYRDIWGLTKENQAKAQELTTRSLSKKGRT